MSYVAAFCMYVVLCVVATFLLYHVVAFFEQRRGWGMIIFAGILAFGVGVYVEGRATASHVKHITPTMHRIP